MTFPIDLRSTLVLSCALLLGGCCCDQDSLPIDLPGVTDAVDGGAETGDVREDISTETVAIPAPAPTLGDVARGRAPATVVEALKDLQAALTRPDSETDKARFAELGWTPGWDPTRVGLDGVADKAGAVTVTGWARTSNDVVEFTRRLRSSERFADVTIGGTKESASGGTQDWTITGRLVPPASQEGDGVRPAGMDTAALLAGLNSRAKIAGVSVSGFKPGEPKDRLGFKERRLMLGLRGGFVGTVDFFAALSEIDPGLRVGDFSIGRGPSERRGGGMLVGSLELFTYAAMEMPADPAEGDNDGP